MTIKKINILTVTAAIMMAPCLVSCKKFLDKKPDSSLALPETLVDLQAILDKDNSMINQTPAFGEASADDHFILDNDFNFGTIGQNAYKWMLYDYNGGEYQYASFPVYSANVCLDAIKTIPVTGDNRIAWNNVKGSALFYRAYYFLWFTWQYGKAYDSASSATDLGIILRLSSDATIRSVRSSVKESYERVINDTKEAAALLPDIPLHVVRPSKAAAYGLLARVYLSMRKYDSAFKYADLCLSIKHDLMDFNTIQHLALLPFQQYNKEVIFHSTRGGDQSSGGVGITRGKIDTNLLAMYDTNDLRRSAYFYPVGNYDRFKGSYAQDQTGFFVFFTGIATDEMYLTRAECYARAGDTASALGDLNTLIRSRWKNTVIPYPRITAIDSADALGKILIERRKELVMRCLRWIDIKRLNKENANIKLKRIVNGLTFELLPNANYYALPLPTDLINITGIPQNPR